MEIDRFIHDEVEYVIGTYLEEIKGEKVAEPWISATSKKAKKKRGRSFSDKRDNFFKRITIKNPITFYKKVYRIFDEYLGNFNYVIFSAWEDDKAKREKVYIKALEKMGFKVDYLYICPWHKTYRKYVMCREGYEIKKKEYKKIFKSLYGFWEWNGQEWIEEK